MSDEFGHTSEFNNFAMEEITGKVILIAIIAVCVAVLLVLSLYLYAKMLWWPAEQTHLQPLAATRHRRLRFLFAPGPDPSRARGLDPSVLRSIPIVVYKAQDFEDGLECAVCLSELVDGEKARLLPKCNHGFHVDCVDMWFQSHSTCPLCRDIVSGTGSPSAEANVSFNHRHDAPLASGYVNTHEVPSETRTLASGHDENHNSVEVPCFPTNVLVWGDQNQVSTGGCGPSEGSAIRGVVTSYGSGVSGGQDGELAIDIPRNLSENSSSASTRSAAEEEPKSPMTTRLRSLKKLLSWEKRPVNTSSSSTSADV